MPKLFSTGWYVQNHSTGVIQLPLTLQMAERIEFGLCFASVIGFNGEGYFNGTSLSKQIV